MQQKEYDVMTKKIASDNQQDATMDQIFPRIKKENGSNRSQNILCPYCFGQA
jgi:hypothetical protein